MHILHISLLILAAPTSFAGTTTSLSLPETADHVRRFNPSLVAARLAIDEARGRLLGSGRLSNPTLSVDYQGESRVSPSSIGASFDQAFPVTRRLSLERRLSAQLVTSAELEVLDAERKLIAEAQAMVVRYIALDQQRALLERQAALATELSTFAKERSEKGELSPLDAVQAQVDAQRALLESQRMESDRVGLLGDLKPKLGIASGDSIVIRGELPPVAMPEDVTWQRRADYQAARIKEASALTGIDLAKARRWQDISAGLFVAKESQDVTPSQRENTGFAGFRVSLPLPLWNRNQGEIAEKAASAHRAALETRALASEISNDAATARAQMKASAGLAAEIETTLLPLIREQAGSLEKAYASGQTDLLTLLRAREQSLQMEAAVLDAVRDFHIARIRYEAAIGLHAPAGNASK